MAEYQSENQSSEEQALHQPIESQRQMSPLLRRVHWTFFDANGLRAGWRVALFILLAFTIGSAMRFVLRLVFPHPIAPGLEPASIFASRLLGSATLVLATLIMAMIERKPFAAFGLPVRSAFGRLFWAGSAWGFGALTFLLVLLRIFHSFDFGTAGLTSNAAVRYGAAWLVAFLMVGFFEEFLFRGYVLITLASGIGFWPAATVLSLLFGYAHSGNSGESWVGLTAVVVVGLFFCLTVRRTGNLWWVVGFHMAFDWAETFFYGVPDSGMVATGHLLNSHLQGNKWISGGTVGPEGSVLIFVVLGLTALLFANTYRHAALSD